MEGPSYPEVVKVNVLEKNLSLPKRVYQLLHRLLMWKLGQLCHCIAPPAFLEFCLPNNPAKCVCVRGSELMYQVSLGVLALKDSGASSQQWGYLLAGEGVS